MSETIAARISAAGVAAVAAVRLSGPRTRHILGRLFRPRRGQHPLRPWRLHLGRLIDPGPPEETVDECLAAWMPAPRSYTGEDVAELYLHGGRAVVERALRLLFACGARPARPGEFTHRAYLAGKLDLTQAEAVCDIVCAQTEAAARLAAAQLAGGLSRRYEAVRDALAEQLAQTEAAIDFPEEELDVMAPAEAARAIREGPLAQLERLLADARAARPLREGVLLAICGRPNVGKSTLLNALLGRERALTSPEPGTTRDFIEESLELDGVPVRLADTAGLREAAQGIEARGVALAVGRLEACDLALAVLDASETAQPDDHALAGRLRERPHLCLLNKSDLPARVSPGEAGRLFPRALGVVRLSALTGEGVEELKERLAELLAPAEPPEVAPSLRHEEALGRARTSALRAAEALEAGLGAEVVAEELKAALAALGEISGETASGEILERIFSRFCIGK